MMRSRPLVLPRFQGFALIELLLVLGIGILITSGVWASYASRNEDTRVAQSLDGLLRLIAIADQSYANSGGYKEGSTPIYATVAALQSSAGDLPDSVLDVGGGAYTNPWGGNWTVGVENSTGTAADLLAITITAVPSYACLQFIGFASPQMYDTTVNGSLVGLQPASTTSALGRNLLRVSQAAPLCNNATNTIKFRHLKPVDYTMLRDRPFRSTLDPNPASIENTFYVPAYNRIEAAITARESAQAALP